MSRTVFKRIRWSSAAKKAICATAAGVLAISMMPATALASVTSDGTVFYTLPAADQAKSFQHQLKDSKGNSYTQEYLSVAVSSPGYTESTYYLLGVNDTTATKDLPKEATDGTVKVAKLGLYGTAANANPDEYLWNYCVKLNGGNPPADSYTSSGNVSIVTKDGTEYNNMPRAVYMECNLLNFEASAVPKGSEYSYSQWVEIENQRPDRPKEGTYNPSFATWSTGTGGFAKLADSLYTIAGVCDGLIEKSKDSNGNYTLATRYVDGPNTYKVVQNYEDITKATQYLLLSKFADNSLKKATAAVIVGYDPNTKNYACRILNTNTLNSDGTPVDPNTNKYGGRLSNSVASICNDICDLGLKEAQPVFDETAESDYVKWYTPEQIVSNCDAVLISDGTGGYCAKDSTGKTNSVYSALASEEQNENIQGLIKAQVSAKTAGKKYADIAWKWPDHVFNCYYAQGCENVLLGIVSACFLYPEVYDLTDTMAWWAKNVWHVTDASLQDIVDSTCNSVSMSRNQVQLGTISANYQEKIAKLIQEGNNYYLKHTEEIDALNHGNLATYDLNALKDRTKPMPVEKSTQNIKLSPSSKTYKASSLKKSKQSFTVKVKGAKGKVSYKSSSKKVTVTSKGKVTVKKGAKKGTYKVKVSAAATSKYKSASSTLTIKVK